eukprot:symbB.v1.2.015494.t1/scaffold1160.1/size134679/3
MELWLGSDWSWEPHQVLDFSCMNLELKTRAGTQENLPKTTLPQSPWLSRRRRRSTDDSWRYWSENAQSSEVVQSRRRRAAKPCRRNWRTYAHALRSYSKRPHSSGQLMGS